MLEPGGSNEPLDLSIFFFFIYKIFLTFVLTL